MRVNIYAEEMTERVEIISKEIEGETFTGLRLYLELPVTTHRPSKHDVGGDLVVEQVAGPFVHHPGDDDSAAITFWGKKDLRKVLRVMLGELDKHYDRPSERTAKLENGPSEKKIMCDHKRDLDRVAGAVYPHKRDRFTYSVDFMITEIEQMQSKARLWDERINGR